MSDYSDLVVAHGASSYWRLGEVSGLTAVDVIGGKHGTISGGVTLNQAGALADGDRAMGFNGTNGKIVTAGPVTIPLNCSIECWLKGNVDTPMFSTRVAGATGQTVYFGLSASKAMVFSTAVSTGVRAINDLQWHHVVVLMNGTTCQFYVDGVADGAASPQARTTPSVGLASIGWDEPNVQFWSGSLDEIAMYPLALTPAQIAQHYTVGRTGFPAGTYPERIIRDGASAYWRLNEGSGTVASELIDGKNGTISGGVTLGQAGALVEADAAMVFDGTTGKAVTPALMLPIVVTIEAWVKVANGSGFRDIVANRGTGSPGALLFGVFNSVVTCYSDDATPPQVGAGAALTAGLWHHVAMVHNGTTCSFYINGTLAGSPLQTRSGTPIATALGIASEVGPSNFWSGSLDEVAIYPYALSPAQIAQHYALGVTRVYPPGSYPATVLASGPSAYWRLNEASGTIASEIIGGKDGTISGGVTLNARGALMDGDPAMTFDGVNGKIQTAANVSLVAPLSVEFWERTTVGDKAVCGTKFPNATEDSFAFGSPLNGLQCFVTYANALSPNSSHTAPAMGHQNGQWHHVVWTFSGGTAINAYYDGVATAVAPSQLNRPLVGTTLGPFAIGTAPALGSFCTGSIDEVAIYPRALPAAEILAHYQARTSGLSPYAARVVQDGASAYWRLGETSGTTAVETVNGVNGTISGGVTLAQPGALLDSDKAMGFIEGGYIQTPVNAGISAWKACECWCKTSVGMNGSTNYTIVDDRYDGLNGRQVRLNGDTGTVVLTNYGGGVYLGAGISTRSGLFDQRWHHVVVNNVGTTYQIFIDAVLDSAGSIPAAGAATIGTRLNAASQSLIGSLDEVAVYPLALTPTQIAAHYDAGVFGYTKTVGTGPDTNSRLKVYVTGPSTDNTTKVAKHLPLRSGEMTARMKALIKDAGASN